MIELRASHLTETDPDVAIKRVIGKTRGGGGMIVRLIVMSLLLLPFRSYSSEKCSDFSGKFFFDRTIVYDNRIVEIDQQGCQSLTINTFYFSYNLPYPSRKVSTTFKINDYNVAFTHPNNLRIGRIIHGTYDCSLTEWTLTQDGLHHYQCKGSWRERTLGKRMASLPVCLVKWSYTAEHYNQFQIEVDNIAITPYLGAEDNAEKLVEDLRTGKRCI